MNMTLAQFTAWQEASVSLADIYNSSVQLINPCDPAKNSDRMLQFLDLRRSSGLTAAQINAYIASTSSGRTGLLSGKGQVIIDACRQYGLNEAYFLAHAILESGWGHWVLGNAENQGYYYDGTIEIRDKDGTYRRFPAGTYYNFFGIGAVDASPLSGGRALAIQNGWNSIDKALVGGAKWIAENYIYGYVMEGPSYGSVIIAYPQPTLYAMKWDYSRSNAVMARGWHQYATDPEWARKISLLMQNCYSYNGVTPGNNYIIPRFK
jgi:beta-N-acetylglucosaminidase